MGRGFVVGERLAAWLNALVRGLPVHTGTYRTPETVLAVGETGLTCGFSAWVGWPRCVRGLRGGGAELGF